MARSYREPVFTNCVVRSRTATRTFKANENRRIRRVNRVILANGGTEFISPGEMGFYNVYNSPGDGKFRMTDAEPKHYRK